MTVMVSLLQKNFNSNNSSEFFLLIPQIDLNLLLLKFFAIHQPSQPFLGCHLDFTTFSPWPSCVGLPDLATPFLKA